jgi:hypothetical protein
VLGLNRSLHTQQGWPALAVIGLCIVCDFKCIFIDKIGNIGNIGTHKIHGMQECTLILLVQSLGPHLQTGYLRTENITKKQAALYSN